MAGIGTFIMLGIVVGSICISLYLFLDGRFVDITEIEKTQVVKDLVTSEIADGVYFQIQITAHNIGTETVRFTGGQFYLYDIDKTKYDAVFIGYGNSDGIEELSVIDLLPNASTTVTTQFDIPYDDEMKYTIGIIPDKFGLQNSQERGFICIKNC